MVTFSGAKSTKRSSGGNVWHFIQEARRYPLLPISVMLAVLILPAIFANVIAPHDHIKADLRSRLEPPGWVGPKSSIKIIVEKVRDGATQFSIDDIGRLKQGEQVGQTIQDPSNLQLGDQIEIIRRTDGGWSKPFGTDKLGRDILSRIIFGSRVSIMVAIYSIVISGAIGTILGLMAGYYGGWMDYVISRLIDIALAIPAILVALVLVVVIKPGMLPVVAVITGFLWSRYARMVRAETLILVQSDFISRAHVVGASDIRIMFRHILPNVVNSLVVLATLQVGFVIIFESALSFLGVGIPRPTPSWGSIIADGRELIIQTAWWVSLFPGIALVLTVLSMNLFGDWLRDKLDPKLRQI